ncbi:hypothetical protein CLIM01_03382 [Colletotrichum limetticola]|uniref:Uncharacterized protein n=1 Tax=Colletotrichum limetticola TaxID=1209924 RepID=A0ABQ9Q6C3_9PEZI|nr:hypothetical protein CLIM01_03382 [Colletotrichum limetticola]
MGFQPNWDGKNRSGSGSEEEVQARRRAGTGDEYHGRSEKRNAGRQSEGGQPRGRGPSWRHRVQASDLRLSARRRPRRLSRESMASRHGVQTGRGQLVF